MSEINRATGLLVLEVVNSNPNGDPDRESDPRQRANGQGEISPVSVKRKQRDLVEAKDEPVFLSLKDRLQLEDGCYEILESRGRVLKDITRELMVDENGDTLDKKQPGWFLKSKFAKKYWDARVFGNTFLEGESDKGTIKTGVVQFGMGLSIKPIEVVRHTNTKKAGVVEGQEQGMAPLAYRVVTHAVYCMPFFVNPTCAKNSGCTAKDLELFKALIPYIYDHTRSAIRPDVRIRHAWFVEHKDALGTCPDFKIFDSLTPKAKVETPTCWEDYDVPTSLSPELMEKGLKLVDLAN